MRKPPLAERLQVRAPCPAPGGWDAMSGSDRVRFCATCQQHVHNVSKLTRDEAEALLRRRDAGEGVCLHLHVRRSDRAILLADGHALRARQLAKRNLAGAVAAATA